MPRLCSTCQNQKCDECGKQIDQFTMISEGKRSCHVDCPVPVSGKDYVHLKCVEGGEFNLPEGGEVHKCGGFAGLPEPIKIKYLKKYKQSLSLVDTKMLFDSMVFILVGGMDKHAVSEVINK